MRPFSTEAAVPRPVRSLSWLSAFGAGVVAAATVLAAATTVSPAATGSRKASPPARVEVDLAPDAYTRPHLLLMTLGGPIYCGLLKPLADEPNASRLCPDFARNGELSGATRNARVEDWGDPGYLDYVATLPERLRRQGVKITKLVLVGVSYSGYADAELVATHPQLGADGLIVADSFLDLAARYQALPSWHPTRREMQRVLGGSPASAAAAYGSRSPSNHLWGLGRAIRDGIRLVVVWSTSPDEQREFNSATCSLEANARWAAELATTLARPVTAYVTQLRHADVLRNFGEHLLALAGVLPPFASPLPAARIVFLPGKPAPPDSYCQASRHLS